MVLIISETLVGEVYPNAKFSKIKYSVIPHNPHNNLCLRFPYGLWLLVRITSTNHAIKNLIIAVITGGSVSMMTDVATKDNPQNKIVDHKKK